MVRHWPLKWKVRIAARPRRDFKLVAFFPLGPRWQVWLEHVNKRHMSPSTVYMFVCLEVCKLLAAGRRFPPGTPIFSASKIDRIDMTSYVGSCVKPQYIQSNYPGESEFLETNHSHMIGFIGVLRHFQHFRSYRGGQFYWRRKPECPEETADLRQLTEVLPNMHTCKHVCIGWRRVEISTVLYSHLPPRPRWSEWVNGFLRHFRQLFSHIVTVFACDIYYGCYHMVLPHWSTVPQTTRTQIPHPVTLSWYRANQS